MIKSLFFVPLLAMEEVLLNFEEGPKNSLNLIEFDSFILCLFLKDEGCSRELIVINSGEEMVNGMVVKTCKEKIGQKSSAALCGGI